MKLYSGDQLEEMLNHATKGTTMNVTLKSGETFDGSFDQYLDDKVWLMSPVRSFPITKIKNIEVPIQQP
jgi:hypothetical protein